MQAMTHVPPLCMTDCMQAMTHARHPGVQAVQEEGDKGEEDTAGGVILAHSMGLGKSLQTIAFLHTFHAYWPGKRSLLLVPSNVLHNWVEEFQRWLPRDRDEDCNELTPSKVCCHCSTAAARLSRLARPPLLDRHCSTAAARLPLLGCHCSTTLTVLVGVLSGLQRGDRGLHSRKGIQKMYTGENIFLSM